MYYLSNVSTPAAGWRSMAEGRIMTSRRRNRWPRLPPARFALARCIGAPWDIMTNDVLHSHCISPRNILWRNAVIAGLNLAVSHSLLCTFASFVSLPLAHDIELARL